MVGGYLDYLVSAFSLGLVTAVRGLRATVTLCRRLVARMQARTCFR
jgi:hypothetical protein